MMKVDIVFDTSYRYTSDLFAVMLIDILECNGFKLQTFRYAETNKTGYILVDGKEAGKSHQIHELIKKAERMTNREDGLLVF